MCKTWSIKYSCSHTFYFHLSRCRGTISTRRRSPFTSTNSPTTTNNNTKNETFSKPACSATPTLTLYPKSLCGPCQRAELEAASEAEVENARAQAQGRDDESELSNLLAERAGLLFRLTRAFPGAQEFREFRRPENGRRARELGGSRLRVVVSAADQDEDGAFLVGGCGDEGGDESRETQAWIDEWAGGWSTTPADLLEAPASSIKDEAEEAEEDCDAGLPALKENAKPSTIRDEECKALVAWSGQLHHGLSPQAPKVAQEVAESDRFRFVLLGVMVGS